MPDYNNSKIYKLFSYENDLVYIGSTTQKLCERLRKHRLPDNRTSSKILFENSANVRIELIEKFSCECREELVKREGHFIREIDCVNKRIAGRTRKEIYEENKKEILEYRKEYYEENKAQILKKIKEYREENKKELNGRKAKLYTCECGKTLTIGNKAPHERTKFHIKYCQEEK